MNGFNDVPKDEDEMKDAYWQPWESMRTYLIVCGCITKSKRIVMSSVMN
jgi:hypothetical protein